MTYMTDSIQPLLAKAVDKSNAHNSPELQKPQSTVVWCLQVTIETQNRSLHNRNKHISKLSTFWELEISTMLHVSIYTNLLWLNMLSTL